MIPTYEKGDVLIGTKMASEYYTLTKENSLVIFVNHRQDSLFESYHLGEASKFNLETLTRIRNLIREGHSVKEVAESHTSKRYSRTYHVNYTDGENVLFEPLLANNKSKGVSLIDKTLNNKLPFL